MGADGLCKSLNRFNSLVMSSLLYPEIFNMRQLLFKATASLLMSARLTFCWPLNKHNFGGKENISSDKH